MIIYGCVTLTDLNILKGIDRPFNPFGPLGPFNP